VGSRLADPSAASTIKPAAGASEHDRLRLVVAGETADDLFYAQQHLARETVLIRPTIARDDGHAAIAMESNVARHVSA
jgi:hypothetical protein